MASMHTLAPAPHRQRTYATRHSSASGLVSRSTSVGAGRVCTRAAVFCVRPRSGGDAKEVRRPVDHGAQCAVCARGMWTLTLQHVPCAAGGPLAESRRPQSSAGRREAQRWGDGRGDIEEVKARPQSAIQAPSPLPAPGPPPALPTWRSAIARTVHEETQALTPGQAFAPTPSHFRRDLGQLLLRPGRLELVQVGVLE